MGKQRSFRTTITIPPDLKKRMDAVKVDINWSAIACRAFEARLVEIASEKVEKNMETVIQRLRVSKLKTKTAAYNNGWKAGRNWAEKVAAYDQLADLGKLAERDPSLEEWFTKDGAPPVSQRLAEMWGGAGDERPDVKLFWFEMLGDDGIPDDDFLRGFVDSALEIWSSVKDEI